MKFDNQTLTDAFELAAEIPYNFILAADSYKTTHWKMLPDGGEAYFSYIEARKDHDFTIFAGIQAYLIKYLSRRVTKQMIDQAQKFLEKHIGKNAFCKEDWQYIIDKYDGFIPVTIRAVPEGLKVPTRQVLCTVECNDARVLWLASYIETMLQRAVWYMTTIATNSFKAKSILKRMYELTGANMQALNFALHDFGDRGVTCGEQAELGGTAHLFSFMGSDTMPGIQAANTYYFDEMAAFSVHASEHSVACAYGPGEGVAQYIEMLINCVEPGQIVSGVGDGYDIYEFTELVTTKYLQQIIDAGIKFVIRPDSGDPLEVLPKVYAIIKKNLGDKIILNENGCMQLPSFLGVLQGDGVDNETMQVILSRLYSLGWAADCIVFGSGGGLLQKVNRDTYKFAQKGSAIKIGGTWLPIFKNPVTDPGKVSKKGRLTLLRSKLNQEYLTAQLVENQQFDLEWEDMLQTVYDCGKVTRIQSLAEIRELIESQL